MSAQVTREQAIEVLQLITAEHAGTIYFKKAEVVSSDGGFGVDLIVDREKWGLLMPERPAARINRVPVCVLLMG